MTSSMISNSVMNDELSFWPTIVSRSPGRLPVKSSAVIVPLAGSGQRVAVPVTAEQGCGVQVAAVDIVTRVGEPEHKL